MLSSYLTALRSFQRRVWLYFAVMALIGFTVDGGIFSVVFNLFLLRLGYGPEFVGQINSAGLFAFALSSLPAGSLGVRLGNRRAMIIGLLVMMVSAFALALSELIPGARQAAWLFGFYIVFHSSIAVLFVNTAPFLMAVTQETQRSHAFALQSAMLSSAAFLGSLIGGLLPGFFAGQMGLPLDAATPYRYPLLLAAVMLVVGIGVLQRIQDPEAVTVANATVPPLPPRRTYPSIFRVPRFQPIKWETMDRAFLTLIL
ncbi:MAG: MFS transporter, partial [Caldilinea sp. CFX5]|nr:MFS transporter [Caldilinea sp. CFX5]